MMNRYQVFFGDKMGCATLGYCEREGRDRDEEHRRYAEFLKREGYTVLSCEGGHARVAVDAGGIVRSPRPDPEERFVKTSVSRRAIAEELSSVTEAPVAPDDRALTAELCRELADELGGIDPEDEEGADDAAYEEILLRYAAKAGLRTA